jgi:hypothetical protein
LLLRNFQFVVSLLIPWFGALVLWFYCSYWQFRYVNCQYTNK